MRRSLPPAVLALAVAVLSCAPAASAKEISGLRACGSDGCVDRTQQLGGDESIFETGAVGAGPARPEPFVRLKVSVREPGAGSVPGWSMLFLPRSGLVRGEGEHGEALWSRPPAQQRATLLRLVRGVRPYPAARLPHDPPPPTTEPVEVFQPATAAEATSQSRVSAAEVAGGAVLVLLLGAAGLALRRRHTP